MGTKLEISDDVLWGKLVKSWATGKNHIEPSRPAPPIPRTLPELFGRRTISGCEYRFPMAWLHCKSFSTARKPR